MPQFRIVLRPEMGKGPEDVKARAGRTRQRCWKRKLQPVPSPRTEGGWPGCSGGVGGNEVPSGDQRMTEMGPEGGARVGTLQKQGSLGKGGPAWVSSNRGERTVP